MPRGQCHRLRNEAAHALYKEQEIGKQTRQALMENDALSRTVERLQKSFSAGGKASKRTVRSVWLALQQYNWPSRHAKLAVYYTE